MSRAARWRHWTTIVNPICRKCVRSRLRLGHMLSWGTVTVTLTAFVCLMVFMVETERGILDPDDAAKSMLLPIIVIQAVILMLLGTGAVASGLARERDEGLLDYHRLSPMSPAGKIVGFLFGLAAREYFLFALTLPFLVWAVVVSKIELAKIFEFYAVFFASVWVYHLTGFVAGMVASKPRRAALMSQGLVILLYAVLPLLSKFGLTFLEFLTFRPTLIQMISEELARTQPGLDVMAAQTIPQFDRPHEVPFFTTVLRPTAFALMVQGFLIVTMLTIAYRKWRNERSHALSKGLGLALHVGTLFFLVGSLWPFMTNEMHYDQFISTFARFFEISPDETASLVDNRALELMLFVYMMVCLAIALVVIAVVTPRRDTAMDEFRRARKYGQSMIRPGSDGATSMPATVLIVLFSALGMALLVRLATGSGIFLTVMPGWWASAAPILLFAGIVLFVQGVLERLGSRAAFIVFFLLWTLPFFTAMILMAAKDAFVVGAYISLPFPPIAGWMANVNFFQTALPGEPAMIPSQVSPHVATLTQLSTIFYLGLALLVQIELRRWRRTLRDRAFRPFIPASV